MPLRCVSQEMRWAGGAKMSLLLHCREQTISTKQKYQEGGRNCSSVSSRIRSVSVSYVYTDKSKCLKCGAASSLANLHAAMILKPSKLMCSLIYSLSYRGWSLEGGNGTREKGEVLRLRKQVFRGSSGQVGKWTTFSRELEDNRCHIRDLPVRITSPYGI